jgi:hypothetical protein
MVIDRYLPCGIMGAKVGKIFGSGGSGWQKRAADAAFLL